jgi:hypothetical protein
VQSIIDRVVLVYLAFWAVDLRSSGSDCVLVWSYEDLIWAVESDRVAEITRYPFGQRILLKRP